MKIVNEKGKLFGIINVVDLLILLVVLCVGGVIVWQLVGDRVSQAVAPQVEAKAVAIIEGAPPELVEEVLRQDLVGEKMVSGNSYTAATITGVWTSDYQMSVETADGEIVLSKDPVKSDIFVEFTVMVAENTTGVKIGSQEVRAGNSFIIKTQTFECAGVVYYVQIGEAE
ncbi:MAG: DUF4330 domain-containing protein [Bacillota bacterium]|nr:DUF4330 domain-containing protein [Bacillota bacterium]